MYKIIPRGLYPRTEKSVVI